MMPVSTHSRVSPSRLQRIIDCPGSFQLSQSHEGEEQQSVYASEGTLLHLATEWHIHHKQFDRINPDCVNPSLDKEQQDAVYDCLQYLETVLRTIGGKYTIHIEKRVKLHDYSEWLYECDGTCDVIIVTDTRILVIDWKFGKGIAVYAQDNDQLYAYAAGALSEYPRPHIEVHIGQPRLENFDVHVLTDVQMHAWIQGRCIPGVQQAYQKNAPFNPGKKQCQWCPAKSRCRARHNHANKTAADIFGAHQQLPNEISLEEISELLDQAPLLEAHIKDLRAFVQRTIENGAQVPGYKVVRGRSIRAWHNVDEAWTYLAQRVEADLLFESKFVSPAKAEKLDRKLKKDEDFQALINKPEGKLTLVKESDKRAPVNFMTAADKFKEHLDD